MQCSEHTDEGTRLTAIIPYNENYSIGTRPARKGAILSDSWKMRGSVQRGGTRTVSSPAPTAVASAPPQLLAVAATATESKDNEKALEQLRQDLGVASAATAAVTQENVDLQKVIYKGKVQKVNEVRKGRE